MSSSINQYARRPVDSMPNPAETAKQALGTLGKVISTEGGILALKNNYVNNDYRVRVGFPSGVDAVHCTVTDEGELRYNSQTFEQFKSRILSSADAEHYKRRMRERARIETAYKNAKRLESWYVPLVVFLVVFVSSILAGLFITPWFWFGIGLAVVTAFIIDVHRPQFAIRITGLGRRRNRWNDTVHDVSPSLAYKVSELATEVTNCQTIDALYWQEISSIDFRLKSMNGGNGICVLVSGGGNNNLPKHRLLYKTSGFKRF